MIIEIRGAQLVNKGAELMLLSVMKELSNRLEGDVKFVVQPNKSMPFKKRVSMGLLAIPRYRKYGINWGRIFDLLPAYVRNELGIIKENELHAVIDVSGFRYGDYWGLLNMIGGLTSHIKRWNRKGIKVLILPQAFGPFSEFGMEFQAKKMLKHADFIAARDEQSYSYLNSIPTNFEKKKLYKYPDFTPSIKVNSINKEYAGYIFIIPNTKMRVNENYSKYLVKIIHYLEKTNQKFAFLIHSGKGDYKIAKNAVEQSEVDVEIIWFDSPFEIKRIIKGAKVIITSRFHGLVNGLSQGVPSISTSWSHKYEMFLKDYDFEIGLIDSLEDIGPTKNSLEFILNNYDEIRAELSNRVKLQEKAIDDMWDKIVLILRDN